MLKVYGRPNSANSAKVFWLLHEIGQQFELIPSGRGFGATDTPEFRALNPFGKVPVIDDDGVVVWESNAILRYLARRFGVETLWPASAAGQAAIDRWMDWVSISLAPPLTAWRQRLAAGGAAAPLPDAVIAPFAALDQWLARSGFIAGDHLTLADIAAAPAVHRWTLLGGATPALAHLAAYTGRLAERSGYRAHIRDSLT